jgi:hypothetical protein
LALFSRYIKEIKLFWKYRIVNFVLGKKMSDIQYYVLVHKDATIDDEQPYTPVNESPLL